MFPSNDDFFLIHAEFTHVFDDETKFREYFAGDRGDVISISRYQTCQFEEEFRIQVLGIL